MCHLLSSVLVCSFSLSNPPYHPYCSIGLFENTYKTSLIKKKQSREYQVSCVVEIIITIKYCSLSTPQSYKTDSLCWVGIKSLIYLLIKKGEIFSVFFLYENQRAQKYQVLLLGFILCTVYMLPRALPIRLQGFILFMVTQWRNFSENSLLKMIVIFMNNFHKKVLFLLLLILGSSNSSPTSQPVPNFQRGILCNNVTPGFILFILL